MTQKFTINTTDTLWCVFEINLTYDDSYYELNESSNLVSIHYTEEGAKANLAEVIKGCIEKYKDCRVDGYSQNGDNEYLINQYCCVGHYKIYD